MADSAALATSMPRLATQVLADYRDTSRARYLDNRFRLEMLLGRYADAASSLAALRQVQQDTTASTRALNVQYEILSAAMTAPVETPFAERFATAFRSRFADLDDAAAAWASRTILQSPRTVAGDLRWATPNLNGRTSVSLDEALTLLRVFNAVATYRRFAGLPAASVAEDDARRYVMETNIAVRTPDQATVCTFVTRPRAARGKLPALMQFTIYADSIASLREALLTAAHGYAGVVAHTRGKACSPDEIVPYKYDGMDAAAVIDWIAQQPWSDGRVGMYGGSYSGFTAWAAAKYMPAPLKAMMVGAPAAPGIDVPMEGNVFWNFLYPWPFYTTNNRWLDNDTYNDFGRWNRLNRAWYTAGRSYREMEKIDGTANPVFAQWLAHPALDSFWRSTVPQGSDYARINIPVLQTAGYLFGGPGGALWYFREHYRNNPQAQHYMLWGPYDHLQAQRGVVTAQSDTATFIAGYEIDPVARIDILRRLRYPWFDHVLKGAPRPALLVDRINYEMMGANVWRHAPSVAAMSTSRMRLYFNAQASGATYTLTPAPGAVGSAVTLTVNLADRSDVDAPFVGGLLDSVLDTANAVTFVSEPLPDSLDVAGPLSGHLELVANRRDFDFVITLYELLPDGQYFQIVPFTARASYTASPSERRLLKPNQVERLDFGGGIRLMARHVAAGSRIVVTLAIPKSPRQQINYGTGRDVSDESIVDAAAPLTIRWLPGSYVELPVRR
ncbi:MAG TPA: CocE/NonD family hydrolase [Gemmatimonadaceae bacterium]|nr:CocE/NonD family hydrolase [Gemmatimonadaceae bacterium]